MLQFWKKVLPFACRIFQSEMVAPQESKTVITIATATPGETISEMYRESLKPSKVCLWPSPPGEPSKCKARPPRDSIICSNCSGNHSLTGPPWKQRNRWLLNFKVKWTLKTDNFSKLETCSLKETYPIIPPTNTVPEQLWKNLLHTIALALASKE